MAYGMHIRADAVLQHLADLGVRLEDASPVLLRWGQRVAIAARNSARARGGRNFWHDVARSVRVEAVWADTVRVHAAHVAAAQKQFGGVIEAKTRAALTIPISDEAKGRRAAEFETGGRDLFVLPSTKGDPDSVGILGYEDLGGGFHPLFVLRRRTKRQKAEPWWPTGAQILADGMDEAERFAQEAIG